MIWKIFLDGQVVIWAILTSEVICLQAPLTLLRKIFHQNLSPVFFTAEGNLLYHNPAGQPLLPYTREAPLSIYLFADHDKTHDMLTLAGVRYQLEISTLEEGRLVILQQQAQVVQPVAPRLSAQLRRRLSTLLATTESLVASLQKEGSYDLHRRPLAVQMQSICQLLHLTRQMELLGQDWRENYPKQTIDLTNLCARVTQEGADLAEVAGVSFSYQCNETSLLVHGNQTLLEWMLMALIANSVRAAGPQGSMGLRLTVRRNQAQIAIWDTGPGLPPEQLEQLFQMGSTHGVLHPGDGAQLGLYLAREIALYHQGALLSSNRQPAGAELLLSLPLRLDAPLSIRSSELFAPPAESFSPALVALSDSLPWETFAQLLED